MKIAAHAVDISRGIDVLLDHEMDNARYALDWDKQFTLAIDKVKANDYRNRRLPGNDDVCSMCGDFCTIKMTRDYLNSALK